MDSRARLRTSAWGSCHVANTSEGMPRSARRVAGSAIASREVLGATKSLLTFESLLFTPSTLRVLSTQPREIFSTEAILPPVPPHAYDAATRRWRAHASDRAMRSKSTRSVLVSL